LVIERKDKEKVGNGKILSEKLLSLSENILLFTALLPEVRQAEDRQRS
jgi:hypothetical protein